LIDLQNSFTAAKSTKFPAKPILGYPPHLKCVAAGLKCAARGSLKILDAKNLQKSPSGHHLTTLSGYIFATEARIHNRKKLVKQQYVLQKSPQYGELRPTSGWDLFVSLGHPQISTGFASWQRYCTACSSGRQPNFTAL